MSNQKKNPNAIQQTVRHHKNFEIYITQYAIKNRLPMSGPIWEAALAAARRLDYTGDRHATPEMRLTPSQASFVNRLFTRFFRRAEPATISEIDDIRAFLEQASEAAAKQSEIRWGMPRNRFASRMEARLLPGGEQKGSRPTPARFEDTPGWELLHRRKLKNGKKTLYVRAHLLHEGMGGAGVGYNLTPMTGAHRDFGANHANFVHYYLVEVLILEAYLNMQQSRGTTPAYREIYYKVEADLNRPRRKGSQELNQIAQAYKESVEPLVAKSRGPSIMPTHQQVMNELARLKLPHLESAMLAVSAELWEDWEDVYKRIVNNQQLWEFEDENVPLALNITYSWVDASRGEVEGPYQVTVPIILPTSLAARFE